jgi:carbonic anhydrase/acetyltransferase-like protein (isoleucine patch superfamily)
MQPLILTYGNISPQIDGSAWIAPTAVIIGETVIAALATVLFQCVLRGDINRVEVGAGSNIQDLSMLHVADEWPCIVGCDVTVGHCALLHGCVVEDGCLIGMGARVLNGAIIGRGSIVAAGAVVQEGMHVPPGSLVAGVPAVVKGSVQARHAPPGYQDAPGRYWAKKYQQVARAYLTGKPFRPNRGWDPDS